VGISLLPVLYNSMAVGMYQKAVVSLGKCISDKLFLGVNHALSYFYQNNLGYYLFSPIFFLLLHPASEEAYGIPETASVALK